MYGYINRYTPGAPATTGIRRVYEAIRAGIAHRTDITFTGENREDVRGFTRNFLEDGFWAKRQYPNCMALIFDVIPFYDSDFQNSRAFWQPSFDALKFYDRVLVNSHHVKKNLVEDMGVDADKVEVQWLGVDRSIFKPMSVDRDAWKKKHGIPTDVLCVGHASAGYTRKNVRRILAAISNIKDAVFVKVGRDNGTEFHIREAGMVKRSYFIETLTDTDLAEFYNAVDVFAFPSTNEGFGLPALEAQACGTPTITGARAALLEITGPGGVAVDPFSVEAIRKDILNPPPGGIDEEWLSQFDWKNIGAAVNTWLS